jgi:hypothetical protein
MRRATTSTATKGRRSAKKLTKHKIGEKAASAIKRNWSTKTQQQRKEETNGVGSLHPFQDAMEELRRTHEKEMEEWDRRFEERTLGFRLSTDGHQATLRRLLPLLLFPPEKRSEMYIELSHNRLCAGTRSSYWTTLMSLEACLCPPNHRSPDGKMIRKKLNHLADIEAATIERPTCCAQEIEIWVSDKSIPLTWATAMLVTFLLGQRLADVCLLQRRSIQVIGEMVAVTFLEGKTIPMTGPYTIHLSVNSVCAQRILNLHRDVDPLQRLFLAKGE